jgi:hypothetical protein
MPHDLYCRALNVIMMALLERNDPELIRHLLEDMELMGHFTMKELKRMGFVASRVHLPCATSY